jgi:methyl-accepting chemotaxis protein
VIRAPGRPQLRLKVAHKLALGFGLVAVALVAVTVIAAGTLDSVGSAHTLAQAKSNASSSLVVVFGVGGVLTETAAAVRVVEDGAKKTADRARIVEQAREAFVTIGSAVNDMSVRVEQIAAAAQEITASASSMQESIAEAAAVAEESSASSEQVSASTEETSASTEQVAASAAEMASGANQLRELVARFRIGSARAD